MATHTYWRQLFVVIVTLPNHGGWGAWSSAVLRFSWNVSRAYKRNGRTPAAASDWLAGRRRRRRRRRSEEPACRQHWLSIALYSARRGVAWRRRRAVDIGILSWAERPAARSLPVAARRRPSAAADLTGAAPPASVAVRSFKRRRRASERVSVTATRRPTRASAHARHPARPPADDSSTA